MTSPRDITGPLLTLKPGCLWPVFLVAMGATIFAVSAGPPPKEASDSLSWAQMRIARRLCSDSGHLPAVAAHDIGTYQAQIALKGKGRSGDCTVQFGHITNLSLY